MQLDTTVDRLVNMSVMVGPSLAIQMLPPLRYIETIALNNFLQHSTMETKSEICNLITRPVFVFELCQFPYPTLYVRGGCMDMHSSIYT